METWGEISVWNVLCGKDMYREDAKHNTALDFWLRRSMKGEV